MYCTCAAVMSNSIHHLLWFDCFVFVSLKQIYLESTEAFPFACRRCHFCLVSSPSLLHGYTLSGWSTRSGCSRLKCKLNSSILAMKHTPTH